MKFQWRLVLFSKKFRLVVLIVLVYVLIRLIFHQVLVLSGGSSGHDFDHDIVDRIHQRGLKAVQLLTRKFTHLEWGLDKLGERPFEPCAEKRCYAFKNELVWQTPLEKSDGVMVHLQNLYYMPSRATYRRSPRQLWLFNTMEPQTFSFCSHFYDITDLDDWFNITTTFKPQSSLLTDYKQFNNWRSIVEYAAYYREFVQLYDRNANFLAESYEKIFTRHQKNKKESQVLWMVSHCDTPSKREVYVNELRKHVGVKIYGSCGFARPDPCRHSDEHSHDQCILDLFAAHKFYLAFENNRCDYYITEKYWKIYGPHLLFRVHTIPVVRGAQLEHYTREAPDNHSFIYADAFASPAHLARYLLYLDANRTAFDEYFAWKFRLVDKFRLQLERHDENAAVVRVDRQPRDDTAVFCEMCSKLHNETYLAGPNPIVYISEFFNPNRDCRNEREGDTLVEFFLKFIGFCT